MKQSKLKATLLAGVVCISQSIPALAEEPHSAKDHNIYKDAPLMTLEEAIDKAIEASPRLRSSKANLEAAEGAERQAGYWPNPELEFEAENISGDGQYSGTDSAEYTYALSQKIEIGGKRSSRKDAAKAVREAASVAFLLEKLSLERDVHIAYANILAEAEALELAIEQENLAKEVLDTVVKRVVAAREPEIQKNKAEVAYATSVISREQEERQLKVSEKNFAQLLGKSDLNISLDHSHFFELEAPDSIKSYQEKLRNAPEILISSYIEKEKESLLSLEKAQNIPDPSLNAGVRDFRDSGNQAFVFGISIPLPVLNMNQGNIAKAKAELKQARSNSRQTELTLEQNLVENWQSWQTSYLEATSLRSHILPAAKKAFDSAWHGYEKGKFPYLEVLDAQRTLFDARSRYHESLKNYHASRANVERLVGITNNEGQKNEN
jgi:cobalt-zinc-cadmium efflux system outer membrane protein